MNKPFRVSDEWEDLIFDYLENCDKCSITEIMDRVFELEPAKHDRHTQMRISVILTKLGWKKVGRGLDGTGNRRHIWKPEVGRRLATSQNQEAARVTRINPSNNGGQPLEVGQQVSQGQNQDSTKVSEVCGQPAQPLPPNFPSQTLEPSKLVKGDIVFCLANNKQGVIEHWNPDRGFSDPTYLVFFEDETSDHPRDQLVKIREVAKNGK